MAIGCAYANIFGRPREGAHAIRLFDVAVVDVALTLVVALTVSLWWLRLGAAATAGVCALFFAAGVLAHWAFCVPTRLNVALGLT